MREVGMQVEPTFFGVALLRDQMAGFGGLMIRAKGTEARIKGLIGEYPGHDCEAVFFGDFRAEIVEEAPFLAEYSAEDHGWIVQFLPVSV